MTEEQEVALAGIRAKLSRAHSQLQRLYEEMQAFSDSEPYATGDPKPNADFTEWVYSLKFRRPIPLVWGVVLGEAVHNLRSALDHSIFQLTLDYFGHEIDGTGFPVSDNSTKWDIRSKNSESPNNPLGFTRPCAMYQLRGVGPGVAEYVKRLQPHSTQNPKASPLLALQYLWTQDKHRLLHFWGLQVNEQGSDIRYEGTSGPYTVKFRESVLHDGDEAVTVVFDSPATEGRLSGKLATSVAFENPADPSPGVDDRVWRLYDATAGIVQTLIAVIDHQDEPIP